MGLCTSSSAASPAGNKEKGRKGSGGGRGIVACGKRTDFGYDKDFEARYALGKLLGHGQFGYTFAAVDRHSAERVAVKRIDKNKVRVRDRLCPVGPPASLAIRPAGLACQACPGLEFCTWLCGETRNAGICGAANLLYVLFPVEINTSRFWNMSKG